jgi:hypothetical protein
MKTREQRAATLVNFGAAPEACEELLAYTDQRFQPPPVWPAFPLSDEPFAAIWDEYAAEADQVGVWAVLQRRLVQLRFPVQAGMSQTEDYRAATLRGVAPEGLTTATGLPLRQPESLRLTVWPNPAGRIPVLEVPDREDFVALLQALGYRNEPAQVPASQGAGIVSGLTNWDRVARYRRQWQAADPAHDDSAWPAELRCLAPRKELYQDRLLLLSTGPYSGTPAEPLGLTPEDWRQSSVVLRRAHEGLHYFTLRVFGSMRNNLLDEILADYAGIVAVLGHYRADWFLRFMGLENYPHYRAGGRLENYRGKPPLSPAAMRVLEALVVAAAKNLEDHDRRLRGGDVNVGSVLSRLCECSLEELAEGLGDPPLPL